MSMAQSMMMSITASTKKKVLKLKQCAVLGCPGRGLTQNAWIGLHAQNCPIWMVMNHAVETPTSPQPAQRNLVIEKTRW